MQVDKKEHEVEAATCCSFLVLSETRLHDQGLSSEVARKFEQTEHVQRNLNASVSSRYHVGWQVKQGQDI